MSNSKEQIEYENRQAQDELKVLDSLSQWVWKSISEIATETGLTYDRARSALLRQSCSVVSFKQKFKLRPEPTGDDDGSFQCGEKGKAFFANKTAKLPALKELLIETGVPFVRVGYHPKEDFYWYAEKIQTSELVLGDRITRYPEAARPAFNQVLGIEKTAPNWILILSGNSRYRRAPSDPVYRRQIIDQEG